MPDEALQYPWYQVVKGDELAQGDVLRDFEVLVPTTVCEDGVDTCTAELKEFDVVVVTQSCDIKQGKSTSLLLCPLFELWDFIKEAKARGENWGGDMREKLRQGLLPGYHLIDAFVHDDVTLPLSVVDFHEVYTSPTNHVKKFAESCGPRLRLCPPYREHLAQAFARFFMRVGLPVDIPKEKLKSHQ